MPWWRFLFWNATGGIVWATVFGLIAFYGGKAAADAIEKYGVFAGAALAALLVVGWLGLHFGRKRLEEKL